MSCIHTSKCSFSEGFFPLLIWGYFFFHHSTQWAPKYHFAEHRITELANCSQKGWLELCVMKSHTRKQSLSKLLSIYFLKIFPFQPWAPMGSQISLCRFQKRVLANCFVGTKLKHCERNSQITKQFLRKFLSRFELTIFPLTAKASMRSKEVLLRFLKNVDNGLLHET